MHWLSQNFHREVCHSHYQVCKVTCCGLMNFQQHCNSKKHLRKLAAAGAAAIPEAGSAGSTNGDDLDGSQSLNPTYVGLQAQCRTYCKQVSSMFSSEPVGES